MFLRTRLLLISGLIQICNLLIKTCDLGMRSCIKTRIKIIDMMAWLMLWRFTMRRDRDKDPHGVLGDEMLGLAAIAIFIGWLAISLYGPAGDNTVTVAWMLK